jgi:hypothetical protein
MEMHENRAAVERGRGFLRRVRLANGAWGYRAAGQPYAEPTCYALLALGWPAASANEELRPAIEWLAGSGTPRLPGVAFANSADVLDNWGTLLAAFALARLGWAPELGEHFGQYAERVAGEFIPAGDAETLGIDGKLRGWPWAVKTASWVEPTAYGILALKALGRAGHPRVREAEAYLADRACKGGGWNYGNPSALGFSVAAMPSNTAFALLALQGRADHPAVRSALDYLEREIAQRQSTLTLALAILCFDLHHRALDPHRERLIARQSADGGWRGSPHLTGLAILALLAAQGDNVFGLQRGSA